MNLLRNAVVLVIFVIIQSVSALEIVSMTVDVGDGVITRGQSLSPSFTVEFADGQKWTDSVFNSNVMFFTLDDPTNSIEVDWWGSRFRRRTGAVDATVTITWELWYAGATAQTTSIIEVKGQAQELVVEPKDAIIDPSDPEHGIVIPKGTVTYTDGSSEQLPTFNGYGGPSVWFAGMTPGDILRKMVPSGMVGDIFFILDKRPAVNKNVTLNWQFTDGVMVTEQSTVTVYVGSDGSFNDPNETAPLCSSKNCPTGNCPQNSANTSCTQCDLEVEDSTCQCECQAGDPVHLNNLEFVVEEVDLEIPGRGINYQFKRTYRSRNDFPGTLGYNWSHVYFMRFIPSASDPNIVYFYNGHARGEAYYIDSGGNLIPPEYRFKKVVKDSDNSLLLRNRNGVICKFYALDGSNKAGKLAAIISRCGNRLTFSYNAYGQLSVVYDSLSRPIHYYYNSQKNTLAKIVDFSGREVIFTQDANRDLLTVTRPAVTGTPTGNDFPQGKTTVYSYSAGFADRRLNHNLISVIRPNEVGISNLPSTVNYYDSDDRLIAQQWGGTNSSGISAGGTVAYARQEVNIGVDPNNPDLPREIVTVNDRNGNETVYYYNNGKNLIKKEQQTRGIRLGDPTVYVTEYKYTATGLLKETINPQGDRTVYEYDTSNPDPFQRGNLLSVTHYPDSERGGDQAALKVSYCYEPVYNQIWKVTEERGNASGYTPPNGGSASAARYTTEYIPDYFEGGLDTSGCSCGHTLRQMLDKFDISIASVQDQLNQGDLNEDGSYNICGNIIMIRYPTVQLRPDSPQIASEGGQYQQIVIRRSFNKYGQYDWVETPEGEVTLFTYYPESDPEGDGQNIRSGNNNAGQLFDTMTGGYLKDTIRDHHHSTRYRGTSLPVQAMSSRGYDQRGNPIWTQDARGVRTHLVYNQLDQVVEISRAADVSFASEPGLSAYGYHTRVYYDYNDNVIKTEIEYRDGNNSNLPQWLETTYIYDILNNVVATIQRVDNQTTITTQLRYDSNENVVERHTPLAVGGVEPANKTISVYDERNLVYQLTTAPATPQAATYSYFYDKNGNLTRIVDACDNNGDSQGDVTTHYYDGFNRLVRTVDAAGNEIRRQYDPASNVIASEVYGPIGGPTRANNDPSGNVLLSRGWSSHDELSRVYQRQIELFVPSGVSLTRQAQLSEGDANPSDGKITSYIDYDRNSRITFATNASPENAREQTTVFYDGLGRTIKVIDAGGNQALSEYDQNGNLRQATLTEIHSQGRITAESFVTINIYDALNRLIRTSNNLGHTRRLYYDSRNLVIKTSDAQGPEQPDPLGRYTAGNINADGNVTQIVHDGLGRSIQTIRELRLGGQGGNELDLSNPGNPDGKIIESTSYDANSRVAAVADDKGNATAYAYDSQNRLVLTTFADGSGKSIEYNADSQPIRTVDNNGNIILASFDSLGRVVRRDITPAAGVKGTTVQTFEYDGLSRVTKAGDNNDPANSSDDSLVQRHYDSLGRLLEESQNGKVVSYNWSQTADPVDLTYPNGRKIEYSLDQLNRLRTIKNNGSATTIAAYDYIGNRLIERVHANGTRLTTLNDAGTINQGYDGLGRLTQIRHLKENTLIAGFGYGYNRENIKSYRQDLKYPHLSELYHYDSRYRLVDFQRGTLNASKDGITGAAINSQTWQLDGVGNWASTVVDGQSQTQTISNMNAYLSFAGVPQTYDTNGNLTNDGNLTFAYDFANRMVEIRDNEDNSLIASYSYDAFNRRISKNIQSTAVSQGDTSGSEYQSDRRTIALYHFNNSSGPIVDSSGNGNDAGPRKRITTVAGLYGTNAAGFSGKRLTAPASSSLDSITDKLTVEAWVYIQPGDGEVKCRLVHRQESFILKIRKDTAKAVFKVFIDQGTTEPIIARAVSDSAIPMQTWVHLAGVYNGKKVKLFVNGVKQRKKTAITGNVHRLPDARLVLGSQNFHGRLEEVRISNKARSGFPGYSTSSQQVLRHFFYAGWTCIEEREQAVLDGGSFGPEKLTRQFVDGANIDEHICVDYYADDGITVAKTYFYHANHRGDIVALTDVVGAVVLELRYSAYGQADRVNDQGQLEEFSDFSSLVVFGFQSRRLDEESFLYHFRSRQYNPVTGRFCQRDGLGYVDGYNLYLAFRGAPLDYKDPLGSVIWQTSKYPKLIEDDNPKQYHWPPGTNKSDSLRRGEGGAYMEFETSFECKCKRTFFGYRYFLVGHIRIKMTTKIRIFKLKAINYFKVENNTIEDHRDWIILSEQDHIDDYNNWAKNKGINIAISVERFEQRVFFGYRTEQECQNAIRRKLKNALYTNIKDDLIPNTIKKWDTNENKSHTYALIGTKRVLNPNRGHKHRISAPYYYNKYKANSKKDEWETCRH